MSKTKISPKVQNLLWAKASGRCEYEGCNKLLYEEALSKDQGNFSNIAHIIADEPNGPRGDIELSKKLANDESNLMLMCHDHHKDIDDNCDKYPVELLKQWKLEHEERIRRITDVKEQKQSLVISYAARIGKYLPEIHSETCKSAIFPERYPDGNVHQIGTSMLYEDTEDDVFWISEANNLETKIIREIKPILKDMSEPHCSIFGLAPQPLLVKLGTLLNDLYHADIYQYHRVTQTWSWLDESENNNQFIVERPTIISKNQCLIFALSSDSIISRVKQNQKSKSSIWIVTVKNPDNNMLQVESQLRDFNALVRNILKEIKTVTDAQELHVYMAMPAAMAIEFGRVWMPKADLSLLLYDYNIEIGEDRHVLTIKYNKV